MITHHPRADLLFDYAAGSLSEPLSLVVASHVSMCAACRGAVERYDAVGGALLKDIPETAVADSLLERTIARLDKDEADDAEVSGDQILDEQTLSLVPPPLRPYLAGNLRDLSWRRMGRSIHEHRLPLPDLGYTACLMKFQAGKAVVDHSHMGEEHTLVLAGGYSDRDAHYGPGDLAFADSSLRHRPVADPGEDCVCLVVLDAPTRLTGPIGRFLNPFIKS